MKQEPERRQSGNPRSLGRGGVNGNISVAGIMQVAIAAAIGFGVNFLGQGMQDLAKATAELSAHSVALQSQVSKLDQTSERIEERLRIVERQVAAFEYQQRKK